MESDDPPETSIPRYAMAQASPLNTNKSVFLSPLKLRDSELFRIEGDAGRVGRLADSRHAGLPAHGGGWSDVPVCEGNDVVIVAGGTGRDYRDYLGSPVSRPPRFVGSQNAKLVKRVPGQG